jgi:hypothetical protein
MPCTPSEGRKQIDLTLPMRGFVIPVPLHLTVAGLTKGGQKKFHILLVVWPVYCDTSTDTYPDMRCWMCLVDEPKSGAIVWNYSYRDSKLILLHQLKLS